MESIERYVVQVLNGLKNGEPTYLSDILYGIQKYPSPGSDEDTTIRLLEELLISQGLVIVVEPGGTNSTQDGYYVVRISSKGLTFLKGEAKYALSTKYKDDVLQTQGLRNVGLLGFIDANERTGCFPLRHFYLSFPRGKDNFYTLDVTREKFEDRNPIDLGILGFARKTGDSEYYLLHRFFDDKTQNHIYITNPDFNAINKLNLRHEYKENPIYIKRTDISGGLPLYLYSLNAVDFFTPIDDDHISKRENNRANFPDDLEATFEHLLIVNNVDLLKFSFNLEGEKGAERSATVSVNETPFNFYVNLQKNQTYFTVRRNPEPNDEAYIIHDIDSWAEVEKRFERWISDIKSEFDVEFDSSGFTTADQREIGESITGNLNRFIHKHYDYAMGDSQDIDPALNVEQLAGQVAKIINNLRQEPGNMTGIFAQWGRGKTRMMNEIWKFLQSKDAKFDYELVRYQAWRYQDTPASWAYLYEQFSASYLGEKRSVGDFIKYHWRLLRLNIVRDGWASLLASTLFFSLALWGVWRAIQVERDIEVDYSALLPVAVVSIGAILSVIVKNWRSDYLTKAIGLIKKYIVKVSFHEALGVQAEIQKQLVHLMNAWIRPRKNSTSGPFKKERKWIFSFLPILLSSRRFSEKSVPSLRPSHEKGLSRFFVHILMGICLTYKKKQKKIVLFVDDLDRCSDEKIIEIIDSLRIILDNEELKDKLIIVTAIDERMLRMAVGKKFGYDDTMKAENPDMIREYIDKLFIFSIKLAHLDDTESAEFFDKLVKDEFIPEVAINKTQASTELQKKGNLSTMTARVGSDTTTIENPSSNDKGSAQLKITYEKLEKPSEMDIRTFKSKLGLVEKSTPRKIRILYYRYLFTRNLLIQQQLDENENSYWLNEDSHSVLIELLIQFSQSDTRAISEEKKRCATLTDSKIAVLNSVRFDVDRIQYKNLLSIFETTIAY